MIAVDSYLYYPNFGFVSVHKTEVPPEDDFYIEGAVKLIVNDVNILDTSLDDYVDQLWAYIVHMLSALKQESETSSFFPDQPVKLTFSRATQGKIRISLDTSEENRTAEVSEDEFNTSITDEAERFFTKMIRLVPSNASSYQESLDQLKAVRSSH